jgi:hypothetical protein
VLEVVSVSIVFATLNLLLHPSVLVLLRTAIDIGAAIAVHEFSLFRPLELAAQLYLVAQLLINGHGLLPNCTCSAEPSQAEVVEHMVFYTHMLLKPHSKEDCEATRSDTTAESCEEISPECWPESTDASNLIRVSLPDVNATWKKKMCTHADVPDASTNSRLEVVLACGLLWWHGLDVVDDMHLVEPCISGAKQTKNDVRDEI